MGGVQQDESSNGQLNQRMEQEQSSTSPPTKTLDDPAPAEYTAPKSSCQDRRRGHIPEDMSPRRALYTNKEK